MAHIIREEKAEPIALISVYVIVSPFERKVYINKCAANRLKATYAKHYNLLRKITAPLFEQAKKKNMKPQMFLLETIECSQRKAFQHCVAWARLFSENGYALITTDVIKAYIDDPIQETEEIYQAIKNCSLDDVMASDKSLFPKYGDGLKKSKDTTPNTVHFSVKPHEYIKIKKAAEASEMTLANYCKHRALRDKTVKIDLTFMAEYLNLFAEDKAILRQILFAIYNRGEYFPADLQNIQRLIEHLTELQKAVQEDINKVLEAMRE